ncbi:hypothetical protein C475_02613 [Halosimplex carlsbadense 2-9-1]|uniref:GNAT family N-acetyltransferase n=1 Tax=Halosimplex carlsbadense 2-9-1 TaxID=797114 RepID=M0D254_9EURY|nr:GNAT family N-acetyltransferase [Halosimplex carlsbadense]ELZ29505.1 hypothetical protein C475_02613 [Halosimplex carlsbadense 2-9-1]
MTDDASAPAVAPLSADHYDDFRRIVDYAFHPEEGPRTYDDEPERIADRYGAFVGDNLVSICGHYDFRANLRGEWVPLAGLAAVATPPEHRREGHVAALVEDALDRWRGEYPLAALWPFSRSYYEQFGWATANTATTYTCPPEQLAFARGAAQGRARPVEPDEWRALQSVHETAAEATTLALKRRSETWWRERVLSEGGDDRPWAYVWERDGQPRGYLVYTFEDDGEGFGERRLAVDDMAAVDHEARLGLLGFLADHDSQTTDIRFESDDRTDLLDLVDDPDAVGCEVETGPMVRVVDVVDALEACPYPETASADLTVRVTDERAEWNDGRFRLTVEEGTGECERVAVADGDSTSADATLDAGTLSQLVVGYHDAAAARRVGDLSVVEESVAETLTALFPPERVYLRTFF